METNTSSYKPIFCRHFLKPIHGCMRLRDYQSPYHSRTLFRNTTACSQCVRKHLKLACYGLYCKNLTKNVQTSFSLNSRTKIILGSASVARQKILAEMGYEFTIMTADIDEKSIRKESPEELVMALAEAKADAILLKLQTTSNQERVDESTILIAADTAEAILQRLPVDDYLKEAEPTFLITSDQVVVYEGAIREKPSSKEEAQQFLKDYSGGHAATVGSVLVTNLKSGLRKGDWDRVEIYFNEIPDEIIEKLVEEGITLNVAGGLIIEHPMILPFVKEVVGTTDSVMGLPKALTEKLLREAL